jgi:hypothetical protein
MALHGGHDMRTPGIVGAFLASLLLSASAQASSDGCSAEVVLQDAAGGAPRIALSIRLLDGTGKAHVRTVGGSNYRLTFDRVGCGPSTLEVLIPADSDRLALDEPLRVARQMFDFDDHGRAKVDVSILPIRPVRCRVGDSAKKPVIGGTVGSQWAQ